MKKYFIIICAIVGFWACTEERAGYYVGEDNWVQFYYTWPVSQEYIYYQYGATLSPTNLYDTVYFRLHIIGRPSDSPRKVRFETYQAEMDYDYYVPAISGEDYIAFDDPEMEQHLIVPGDTAYFDVPVILKYNPDHAGSYVQGDFRLVDSEDLIVGDTCLMKGRFQFYHSY